jgi:hypothetical protein
MADPEGAVSGPLIEAMMKKIQALFAKQSGIDSLEEYKKKEVLHALSEVTAAETDDTEFPVTLDPLPKRPRIRQYDEEDMYRLIRDIYQDYYRLVRQIKGEPLAVTNEEIERIANHILFNLYVSLVIPSNDPTDQSWMIPNTKDALTKFQEVEDPSLLTPFDTKNLSREQQEDNEILDLAISNRAKHVIAFPDIPTNALIFTSAIDGYQAKNLIPPGMLLVIDRMINNNGDMSNLTARDKRAATWTSEELLDEENKAAGFLEAVYEKVPEMYSDVRKSSSATGELALRNVINKKGMPSPTKTPEEVIEESRVTTRNKSFSNKDAHPKVIKDAILQYAAVYGRDWTVNAEHVKDRDERTVYKELRDEISEGAAVENARLLNESKGLTDEERGAQVYQWVVNFLQEANASYDERVAAARDQRQRGSYETVAAAKKAAAEYIANLDFLEGKTSRLIPEDKLDYLARMASHAGGMDNVDPYILGQIPGWQAEKENLDLLAGKTDGIEEFLENLGIGSIAGQTDFHENLRINVIPKIYEGVRTLIIEDPTRTDIESYIRQMLTHFPESNEEIWKQRMGREGVRTLSDPRLRALGVTSIPSPPSYLSRMGPTTPVVETRRIGPRPTPPPTPTLTPTFGYTTERRGPTPIFRPPGRYDHRISSTTTSQMPPQTTDISPSYVQPQPGIGGLERRSPTSDIAQIIFNSGRYPAPPSQIDTLAGIPPVPTFETAPFYRPAPLPPISQSDLQETINRFAKGDKGLAFYLAKSMPEIVQRFQSQYTGALKASRGEDITQRKQATLAKRYEAAGTPAERSRLQGEREKLDVRSETRRKGEVAARQRSRDMWYQGRQQGPSKDLTYWLNFLKTFR